MLICRLLFEFSFLFKEVYVNNLILNNMVLKWKIWGYLLGNIWKYFSKGCFVIRLKFISFFGDFGIKYYLIWV